MNISCNSKIDQISLLSAVPNDERWVNLECNASFADAPDEDDPSLTMAFKEKDVMELLGIQNLEELEMKSLHILLEKVSRKDHQPSLKVLIPTHVYSAEEREIDSPSGDAPNVMVTLSYDGPQQSGSMAHEAMSIGALFSPEEFKEIESTLEELAFLATYSVVDYPDL